MTVDLFVNVALVLFISSNLAILYMSNIGYVTAHIFAMTGFLLLRKDRPNWPRPIKVAPIWIPVAVVIAASNIVFLVVGSRYPKLTGYGGLKEFIIGISILLGSIVLFAFRRIVQDKERVHWREETPTMPDEVPAPAVVPAG